MHKNSRLLCFVLSVSLLFMLSPRVTATSVVQPRYIAIQIFSYNIDIDSDGIAKCTGSVEVRGTNPIKLSLQLQRYQNGLWITVNSWTKTGSTIVSMYKEIAVAQGYTYRLVAKCYVYNSNNVLIETDDGIRSAYY